MPRQFDRQYRLNIRLEDGTPILDTDKLRVVFEIKKTLSSVSNQAKITIYNINDKTFKRLNSDDTLLISVAAGYPEFSDIIFSGIIRTVNPFVKEGPDRKVELIAADGDRALRYGTVSLNFSGGTLLEEVLQKIVDELPDVKVAIANGVLGKALPERGESLTGDVKVILDRLGAAHDFSWSIQDDILETLEIDPANRNAVLGDMGQNAYIVSSKTGMVSAPVFGDNKKLTVKALLNPRIKPGRVIKVESRELDDFFKVINLKFSGDTDGPEWYMEIEAQSLELNKGT